MLPLQEKHRLVAYEMWGLWRWISRQNRYVTCEPNATKHDVTSWSERHKLAPYVTHKVRWLCGVWTWSKRDIHHTPHIFFFKSWCHAWHTHAWHTHFNMLSIICGAAFIRDISREVQIFLHYCGGGKFKFLTKSNFNFIFPHLKCFYFNMYNFLYD